MLLALECMAMLSTFVSTLFGHVEGNTKSKQIAVHEPALSWHIRLVTLRKIWTSDSSDDICDHTGCGDAAAHFQLQ